MKKHRLDPKLNKSGKYKPLTGAVLPPRNSKSRPVHKEAVFELKARIEQDHLRPEPMQMMHKRIKDGEIPGDVIAELNMIRCGRVYCPPEVTAGVVESGARAMADWDNSDPFAYGRTALYIRQGYVWSAGIVKEMTQRTMARKAARRKEVEDAKSHA